MSCPPLYSGVYRTRPIKSGIDNRIFKLLCWVVFFFFLQGLFPPGQGATIGVDFMIKTVEIKGEKVKVWEKDHFICTTEYCLTTGLNIVFSSCRYGTQQARRDFAPLLRVITVVPMPSFLRMTLPVRTPSGAFQSG